LNVDETRARCYYVDVVQAETDSDADAAQDTHAPERMWREATARTRATPGCDSVQRQNSGEEQHSWDMRLLKCPFSLAPYHMKHAQRSIAERHGAACGCGRVISV